jgi:hypothetical protein
VQLALRLIKIQRLGTVSSSRYKLLCLFTDSLPFFKLLMGIVANKLKRAIMSTEWSTFLPVLAQSAATLLALLPWELSTALLCIISPEGKRHA